MAAEKSSAMTFRIPEEKGSSGKISPIAVGGPRETRGTALYIAHVGTARETCDPVQSEVHGVFATKLDAYKAMGRATTTDEASSGLAEADTVELCQALIGLHPRSEHVKGYVTRVRVAPRALAWYVTSDRMRPPIIGEYDSAADAYRALGEEFCAQGIVHFNEGAWREMESTRGEGEPPVLKLEDLKEQLKWAETAEDAKSALDTMFSRYGAIGADMIYGVREVEPV